MRGYALIISTPIVKCNNTLAAQRCNSDVQLPYRFPITKETHFCDDPTCFEYSKKEMIEATQIAQDAQAGYACDYVLYQASTFGVQ